MPAKSQPFKFLSTKDCEALRARFSEYCGIAVQCQRQPVKIGKNWLCFSFQVKITKWRFDKVHFSKDIFSGLYSPMVELWTCTAFVSSAKVSGHVRGSKDYKKVEQMNIWFISSSRFKSATDYTFETTFSFWIFSQSSNGTRIHIFNRLSKQ